MDLTCMATLKVALERNAPSHVQALTVKTLVWVRAKSACVNSAIGLETRFVATEIAEYAPSNRTPTLAMDTLGKRQIQTGM